MSSDYNNYITPFYEIEVSDAAGKRKAKLPHHILRLVDKIEIKEAFASPENMNGATTGTISFVEGSREPASQDPTLGTAGLYQLPVEGTGVDMDISGSITNRVGSIVDLRFSGNSGITFLSQDEKKVGALSPKLLETVEGKKKSRKFKKESQNPKFLFDAFNKVKITWGYKEDPSSIRSMMLSIVNVETVFSDSGPTTINIQLADYGAMMNQVTPKDAVAFGTVKPIKGNAVIEFEDIKTDVLIRNIAEKAGMAAIISKNIPADTLDKSKQKMWIAGESFHEFLSRLAAEKNCYYKVITNPKTEKPTIYFIKREDFEAKPPLPVNKYFLLEYKHPGSLIKSVTVNADFVNPTGAATSATDDNGDQIQSDEEVGVVQFKNKEGQIVSDPTVDPAVKGVVDNLLGGNYTGNVTITPNQNPKFHEDRARVEADKSSRLVAIDIITLGYPKFTPGVYNVNNIGLRYSGKYRILNVIHSIDSTGYLCRMSGTTHSLASGGTKIPDAVPGKEQEEQVETRLFKSANGTIPSRSEVAGEIRDAIDDSLGTKG
jgi:hypothetical protein